jgi:hypothetical protein
MQPHTNARAKACAQLAGATSVRRAGAGIAAVLPALAALDARAAYLRARCAALVAREVRGAAAAFGASAAAISGFVDSLAALGVLAGFAEATAADGDSDGCGGSAVVPAGEGGGLPRQ